MNKLLKYGFLVLFAAMVFWGGWLLFHPEEKGTIHVVLDPGHGGEDPGAMVGEAAEKNIDLAIALLVREQLEGQEGISVSMTREEDIFISLDDRAEFANREKADLYVSIHANALENDESFAGIFTYYHPDKKTSKAPAKTIQAAVTASSGGIDRGIRSADYAVLRQTDMPAVLVETGFMTCPDELAMLLDPDYQLLLAQGIAQGILKCDLK